MEYAWTKEQSELYEKTLAFAQSKLNEFVQQRVCEHRFPADEWRMCGQFGLLGLCVPKQYGGMGLDALTTARVEEAMGKGCEDQGLVFSTAAHLCASVMPILESGSDEIKEKFLPRMCSGEWIGANAMTETEAGSDISSLKTGAVHDGNDYILNGFKSYVSNAPVAKLFVVYASTNPQHGHWGISPFVVERDRPGISIGEPFKKMGLNTSPISWVKFENCRVPAHNRLGDEGKGAAIFARSMQWERACLLATYVGLMERQLEQTVAYASQRKQYRKPIGKKQVISHRIVDMKLRLESARLLLYRACWLMDQQKDAVLDVSMAKLAISEAAIQSSLDAIQIHGGNGYLTKTGVEQMLRDAIPSTIFSGTSEIQRDLIASKLEL
ncbi:MAG: acyl-CoA dehydrogenase [Symploca sp. SIO1B1]|nr:acyl-CoA dehydrogenase [Symploca sp. SIO2D2]NER96361.1 acyl-CoA dehydrogenase [Symploca sp. SIO1B1]